MLEDRGLPEPGFDYGGTAELGGLKDTCGRQLITIRYGAGYEGSRTSFNLSNIWMVVSQSTHASVILTPYLSPDGPDGEKWVSVKERSGEKVNPTIFGNVLSASVNVGFDHDTSYGAVASNQLFADGIDDFWLIVMVLERVSV